MADSAERPVYSINPPILLTMNDEMARQLVATLESINPLPPAVWSFKQSLKADLNRP